MKLIQTYLFRQLLGPTVFATVALTTVALLSQSLSALDVIVDQRQSLGVFLYITLLALPQLFSLILPVALFVASILALNRLHTEQEIVVCFAGGMSRWQVTAPMLKLAAMAVFVCLFINLWVQPLAARALRQELFRARADLAAALVRPGEFIEPAPGLTVYAQEATPEGRLKNLFVHQQTPIGSTTFNAREGQIVKAEGAPLLVMRKGSSQQISRIGVLNYLSFDEYSLDLAPFLAVSSTVEYKTSDRWLHELVAPDLRKKGDRERRRKMLAEANSRIASPLYNLAFVALALASVLGGAFSRMGYGRRIILGGAAAVIVRVLGFAFQSAANTAPWLSLFQYVIPLAVFAAALWIVFKPVRVSSARPAALPGGIAAAGAA
ncbi:MAG: LPS export ABC transporter permease LptF [Caulobacteraceae bacterium]